MNPDQYSNLVNTLFVTLASGAGPNEWDWQRVATAAFDAADAFQVISIQRTQPQASTPATDPSAAAVAPAAAPDLSVLPGQIGAVDPAAAAQVPPPAPTSDPAAAAVAATPATP